MRVRIWLPLALGIILPATYLAVKWSGSEAPSLPTPPAAVENAILTPDKPAVFKKVVGQEGKDQRTVTYRMSKEGSPLACYVGDENGSQLLKCSFGYSTQQGPTHGKVVEVRVFDAREAVADTAKKGEPLQRLIYSYDAAGSRAKPITIDIEPTGLARNLLGTALVGFDPLTDWNSADAPGAPR